MKDLGIEAYGIEYDKDMKYNQRELGITMIEPDEIESLESNSFDIVRAYHILEHLPDPCGTLSIFFRILKENGILLLSTRHSWSSLEEDLNNSLQSYVKAFIPCIIPSRVCNHASKKFSLLNLTISI